MRDSAFLGKGWSFPPAFDSGGASVRTVSGEQDIEQALAILLATARGERVMHDDFGCALSEFVFGEVSPGLIGRLRDLIAQAILYHEPRVRLNDIEVRLDNDATGRLLVVIDYTVRATNSRYNMVHPFYLNEAARRA